jgi:hypothetical protein
MCTPVGTGVIHVKPLLGLEILVLYAFVPDVSSAISPPFETF